MNDEEVLVTEKRGVFTRLEDHTLHFTQGDEIKVEVEAMNGAEL